MLWVWGLFAKTRRMTSLAAVTRQSWGLAVPPPLRTAHIFSKNIFIFKNKNQVSFLQFNSPRTSQNLASSLSGWTAIISQSSLSLQETRKHSACLHTLNSLNLVGTSVIIVCRPRGLHL